MNNALTRRGFALATAATATLFVTAPHAFAQALTLTDIAGREVTLPEIPSRIILGEGRMMYAIAPLATDDPFERIIGWKDDLIQYDPDAFRKFEAAFPEDTARMVNFGNPYAGDFSIEAVLENEADLLILDLGISQTQFITGTHGDHKTDAIETILVASPHLQFTLIGDTGQHDPHIYADIVARHPGRIDQVILRRPSDADLSSGIKTDVVEIKAAGVKVMLDYDYRSLLAEIET